MATNDCAYHLWIVALGAFCCGLLWGGVLWRIVPFPTWETIKRYLSRRSNGSAAP